MAVTRSMTKAGAFNYNKAILEMCNHIFEMPLGEFAYLRVFSGGYLRK